MDDDSRVSRSGARRAAAGTLLLAAAAASAVAAAALVARWPAAPPSALARGLLPGASATAAPPLDALLGGLAAAGALLVLAWVPVSITASVVLAARARTRPRSHRCAALEASLAPALVRRLAASAVSVSVLTGVGASAASAAPALPVAAAPLALAWPAAGHGSDARESPFPPVTADRPLAGSGSAARDPGPPARTGPQQEQEQAAVVVTVGDTLWDIAAAHLPHGSSPATIADQWPQWWSANRATVGDDPDLLLPGQVLHVPAGSAS